MVSPATFVAAADGDTACRLLDCSACKLEAAAGISAGLDGALWRLRTGVGRVGFASAADGRVASVLGVAPAVSPCVFLWLAKDLLADVAFAGAALLAAVRAGAVCCVACVVAALRDIGLALLRATVLRRAAGFVAGLVVGF
ncbi:hypothetical protein [Phaeobacter italicus]|uniref:hypothetical protein n=1 Tax=Phaeobacter italicus TaxID=481446 RepID=UPI00242B4827|nr:hypothetical protein [Phaeobacter italicus]MCI5099863.1 hypothetical protein [Phaeobacter italicus]